ncbi:glutathione binding-like protein [Limnobacter litoralis]|uniref:Glutathione S-transferase C-terminal domain-containing protein n=1 Tax=Limnobacter litoralis TaxID=481366 RepID=A0ABQ5YPD3_9BURK|nr:glutathione S-transferase family protein [Limnobacter litoralis]GLR25076.1 hypothetical protein GCM10007875_01630 [Limnobacter litoralis]
MNAPQLPLQVHGLDLSYFTGKLEMYLRNKGIAYDLIEMDTGDFKRCGLLTGVAQMPQVKWCEGQWLSDTTLIIEFLEKQFTETTITLNDPALQFMAELIEDFGDEWLWRPALYYRWAKTRDAKLMGDRLAAGMMRDIPAPHFVRRFAITNRQKMHFLRRDGVNRQTAKRIEEHYLESLAAIEDLLKENPFLLGQRPTLADYGLLGPMFRHFFCDPTPAMIMRTEAPAVHEWVARMWNLKLQRLDCALMPTDLPAKASKILQLIMEDFLPYMQANESAWQANQRSCSFQSKGIEFEVPVNPYRVWRFQRARLRYAQLTPADQSRIHGWAPGLQDLLQQPIERLISTKISTLPIHAAVQKNFVGRQWQ